MKVTYDREAKAMYFEFMERGIDGKTEELIPDEVIIDKTLAGQIAGIEILGVESIEDITRKGKQEEKSEIMATKSIRVDTEVILELLSHSNGGKTPNQILRELLGLPEMHYPHGGASRQPLKNPSLNIGRAEKYLIKAFHELRKVRDSA